MNIKKPSYIDKLSRKTFPYIEYEGFDNRYPALEGIKLDNSIYREMSYASKNIFKIFEKVLRVFKKCPTEFLDQMDIPKNLRPYLGQNNIFSHSSIISRFDFILDDNNIPKIIELNADTPCAIIEAYYGNEIFNQYNRLNNPNQSCKFDLLRLFQSIFMQARHYIPNGSTIVFSCFHDYIEDYGNTLFLMNNAKEAIKTLSYDYNVKFVSFYDLKIGKNALYTSEGEQIKFLYRLHPLELLIDETADDGDHIGEMLLELVCQNKLIMINPIDSILIQNKGFQALVWNLMLEGSFFTTTESDIINKYMLPSYFAKDRLVKENIAYIKKPIWGREGNNMEIIDSFGNEIESKFLDEINGEAIIERQSFNTLYQKFIPSKPISILTDEGEMEGYMTLSQFLLDGNPSAYYARFSSDKIASVEAYWLPLSI